jgi:hypothetical protein
MKKKLVRFNLSLTRDQFTALMRLKDLTGKATLAETIRSALRLYDVTQTGISEGKQLILKDPKTNGQVRLTGM